MAPDRLNRPDWTIKTPSPPLGHNECGVCWTMAATISQAFTREEIRSDWYNDSLLSGGGTGTSQRYVLRVVVVVPINLQGAGTETGSACSLLVCLTFPLCTIAYGTDIFLCELGTILPNTPY